MWLRSGKSLGHTEMGNFILIVLGYEETKTPLYSLDPWELPGSLDADLSISGQQSMPANANMAEDVETICSLGSETVLILELKSIADVGLVGFPKVGKIADIPGHIKGAHENHGLGHAFLRHIECTKVLAYVFDLAAALDGRKGNPPWEQLKDLILDLEDYREGLSERLSLVVAKKIDEAGPEGVYEELKIRVQDDPIFPVCAVLKEGIPELKA
ncbi:GTP binding domain [Dillenia turbinata]|uniref:GTP binding domain n=1 Tax=Dillenia turbinata TaxID=194707 RepID=A0AAN8V8M1_9MAGN